MDNDAGSKSLHAIKKGIGHIYEVKSSKSILYKGQQCGLSCAASCAGVWYVSPGGITALSVLCFIFWLFVVNLCPKLGSE